MSPESKDHDLIFKQGLHHFLKEFLEEFFPKLVQKIEVNYELPISEDANSVHTTKGNKSYVDVVYSARILETGEKVMVHIEPQSYPDPNFPIRMYNYNHTLRKKHNARVITIVIGFLKYPQSAPSRYEEESLIDRKKEHYFRFHRVHLKELFWKDYMYKNLNPIVTCFLGLMKEAGKNKKEIRLISYINLLKMDICEGKKNVVVKFINTYLPFDNLEQEKYFLKELYLKAKQEGLVKELEKLKTPFYNQGREEGKIETAKELILENIQNVNGSQPSIEVVDTLNNINDYNVLKTISNKIWGIKDINEIEKIIRKYK